MDPAQRRAYEASCYIARVDDRDIRIKIGEVCADLERVLARHGAMTWAYMTAWNPMGQTLPDEMNDQRQDELRTALARGGFQYAEGESEPADPAERPEGSLLVVGISQDNAVALAKHFEQLAIIVGTIGNPAKLVDCTR